MTIMVTPNGRRRIWYESVISVSNAIARASDKVPLLTQQTAADEKQTERETASQLSVYSRWINNSPRCSCHLPQAAS